MNGFETILPFLKPIEHLILDDAISEVMVNGPDRIFIEKQGFVEAVQGIHLGEKSLMIAVKNIARRLGDDISESKPILDSRLPDGSRVAAVIPPCSVNGVTLTIRKFNARHFGVEDLVQAGTLERWLGEIRGSEAFDLLQLLNTGHSGSLCTVHATSAKRALARFTSCVLQSGVDLPFRAVKTNVGDSVNVVVHLERRQGRRFISEVVEIHGYDPDHDEFNYGFVFDSHKELV
jgi:Flp pilus assembly CpaF family ATPase